jgi:hypothetical protein
MPNQQVQFFKCPNWHQINHTKSIRSIILVVKGNLEVAFGEAIQLKVPSHLALQVALADEKISSVPTSSINYPPNLSGSWCGHYKVRGVYLRPPNLHKYNCEFWYLLCNTESWEFVDFTWMASILQKVAWSWPLLKNAVSIQKHSNKRISKFHKARGHAHLSQGSEFSPITL